MDTLNSLDNMYEVLIVTATLGSIGAVANLRSGFRLWQTFNIRLALYLILFVDSIIMVASYIVTSLASMLFLLGALDRNRFWCNVMMSTFIVCQSISACMLSLLSILR